MAISVSGKTQKEVADFLGVSKASLTQRLATAKFTSDEMTKICKFIGCEYIEKIRFDDGNEI